MDNRDFSISNYRADTNPKRRVGHTRQSLHLSTLHDHHTVLATTGPCVTATDSNNSHGQQPLVQSQQNSPLLEHPSPNSFLMDEFNTTSLPKPSSSSIASASSLTRLYGPSNLTEPMQPGHSSSSRPIHSRKSRKLFLADPLNKRWLGELENRSSNLHSSSLVSSGLESDGINGSEVFSHPFQETVDSLDAAGVQDLILPYEDFTTIDWMRDLMRDHRRKHRLLARQYPGWKSYFYSQFDSMQSWLLVSIIGISIGCAAAWIDIIAAWLTDIKQGVCITEWYLSKDICCTGLVRTDGYCRDFQPWSWVIFGAKYNVLVNFVLYGLFSIVFAACSAIMVTRLAMYAAGSGAAEIKTILGGFIIKEFLGLRTLIVKSLALPLAVASGLAVGKEEPMVHIACSIGNIFPRLFPKYKANEARKREILSASAAAGIAVAFGAPIGGVLFSLEELSSFFPTKTMLTSFFCALVSRMTLQFIDPYRGKRVMFQVTLSRNWFFFEMISFVLIGIIGGLTGALVIRCSLWYQAFRRQNGWSKSSPVKEIILISALTAAIGYMNVFTRIDSLELLETLFKECDTYQDSIGICSTQWGYTIVLLVFALIIRTILTTITIGTKVPSGIFIPSMVWGALFGRILGISVEQWQIAYPHLDLFFSCPPEKSCVTPGMYALLGAMAGLGGVTKLTVSLTVIMYELTGTLNYIIPCMVTVMVAKLVGDLFGHGGMVEVMIRIKAFPFLDPRVDEIIGTNVSEAMTSIDHLVCFKGKGMMLSDIEALLDSYDYQGFPIIQSDQDTSIVGYITRGDLLYAIEKAKMHHTIAAHTVVFFDNPDFWSTPANESESFIVPTADTPGFGSSNTNPSTADTVNLAYYVDQTPLGVDPSVPIEFVIDMFKKLGPRVIIVKEAGCLKGLVTKKDLLATIYSQDELICSVGLTPGLMTDILFAESAMSSGQTSQVNLNPEILSENTRLRISTEGDEEQLVDGQTTTLASENFNRFNPFNRRWKLFS
ncbi:glycerol ethanol, ferric requiring protein [Batrachochytrium dendrobatidis]